MMRGFYIKIGQMGSQRDDFVHDEYLKRLRTLQTDVPARDISYVKDLISQELRRDFNDIFASIDPEPLGLSMSRCRFSVVTPCLKKLYLGFCVYLCGKVLHPLDKCTEQLYAALGRRFA